MTSNYLTEHQQRIEQVLANNLPAETSEPSYLHQAMRYAVLGGGKRIRPLLVYATGALFNAAPEQLDIPALAVELIHCYSLVHDDLPAMDDDDLRRGKPTCHKAFDEATAMLAGDALQAQAFAALAMDETNIASAKNQMLAVLGQACGSLGMAGGQAIDLAAVAKQLTLQELENMHRLKTGALIIASVQMGAIAAGANEMQQTQLTEFAAHLGLAFQIQDDILDVEATTEQLGKTQGADQARDKPTYPALLGLAAAKQLVEQTFIKAIACLADYGEQAEALQQVANYIVQRTH